MKKMFAIAATFACLAAGAAYAQSGPPSPQGMIAMFDANHDGNISRAEYNAGQETRFTERDANHDGALAGDELPRWASASAGPSSVTRADFLAHSAERFDGADTNHDGQWNAAETAAFMEQMRAMQPPGAAGH